MAQVVEVDLGQVRLSERWPPHAAAEVAAPQQPRPLIMRRPLEGERPTPAGWDLALDKAELKT
jgi:hypothetical protein